LLAARRCKYDRLLEEYNTAEPRPKQVKLLLEKLQQADTKDTERSFKEQDSESIKE
jgi:predicted RecB family nuclease